MGIPEILQRLAKNKEAVGLALLLGVSSFLNSGCSVENPLWGPLESNIRNARVAKYLPEGKDTNPDDANPDKLFTIGNIVTLVYEKGEQVKIIEANGSNLEVKINDVKRIPNSVNVALAIHGNGSFTNKYVAAASEIISNEGDMVFTLGIPGHGAKRVDGTEVNRTLGIREGVDIAKALIEITSKWENKDSKLPIYATSLGANAVMNACMYLELMGREDVLQRLELFLESPEISSYEGIRGTAGAFAGTVDANRTKIEREFDIPDYKAAIADLKISSSTLGIDVDTYSQWQDLLALALSKVNKITVVNTVNDARIRQSEVIKWVDGLKGKGVNISFIASTPNADHSTLPINQAEFFKSQMQKFLK